MRGWKLFGPITALWLAAPAPAQTAAPTAAPVEAAPPAQPTTAPAAPGEPRPALWLLADEDTRIYLFGTVHILHPELRWRSAALDRAVGEAQELVLEVDDDEMTRVGPLVLGVLMIGKTVPLRWRVSPDRREALDRMLTELRIPEGSLDGVQSWAVAMTLGLAHVAHEYAGEEGGDLGAAVAGLTGVEEVLIAEFRANDRPVTGVETIEDQIGAFRGMPLHAQRAMLDQAIDSYRSGVAAGEADEADWVSGNLDRIAALVESLPPELFDALLTRRNRNFADWLAARLDRPGTVLFAVGAGHLAGRASIQSMLESRGLRVTRLN